MKTLVTLSALIIIFSVTSYAGNIDPARTIYKEAVKNADFRSLTGNTMKCWGQVARGTHGGKAGIQKVGAWVDTFHARMLNILAHKTTFNDSMSTIAQLKQECESFKAANPKVEMSYTQRLEAIGARKRVYLSYHSIDPNALLTAIVGRPMTVCWMGTLNAGGSILVASVSANVKGAYCESTTLNRWFEVGVGVGGNIAEYSGLGVGFYGAGGVIDRKGGNMASVYGSQGGMAVLIGGETVGTEDMTPFLGSGFFPSGEGVQVEESNALMGGGIGLIAYGTRNVNVAVPIIPMSQHSPRLLLKIYTGMHTGRSTIQ